MLISGVKQSDLIIYSESSESLAHWTQEIPSKRNVMSILPLVYYFQQFIRTSCITKHFNFLLKFFGFNEIKHLLGIYYLYMFHPLLDCLNHLSTHLFIYWIFGIFFLLTRQHILRIWPPFCHVFCKLFLLVLFFFCCIF